MTLDLTSWTPVSALLGGALIGLAASLLIIANGRVAGISGILAGAIKPERHDAAWRILFIAGLLAAPWLYRILSGDPIHIVIDTHWPSLIIAGLLVGLGTRYGSGCTSGHGVCGLSRWSLRSAVATLTFMCAGFATVFWIRHV